MANREEMKLCKDCVQFDPPDYTLGSYPELSTCHRTRFFGIIESSELIDGNKHFRIREPNYCVDERSSGECGREGKFWSKASVMEKIKRWIF